MACRVLAAGIKKNVCLDNNKIKIKILKQQ